MSLPSARTDICKEVFDENSAPSEEEVRDYALKIGINPNTESHLLHIARDGLVRPLPEGWTPCYDKGTKAFYYYNFASNETRWDHPLDDVYRNIVKKVKTESISSTGEEDSKTSGKEELKSYEEVTIPSEMLPQPLEPLRPLGSGGAVRKSSLQLAPLRKSPSPFGAPPDSPKPDTLAKKLSLPLNRGTTSPRPPIDLSLKRSVSNAELGIGGGGGDQKAVTPLRSEPLRKKDALSPLQEKHPRSLHGHAELTLQGGGSMFLKSKQKPADAPDPDPDDRKSLEVSRSDGRDPPRSILREAAGGRPLWDVDPHDMSEDEKQLWRRQEAEDDRKSVRFNLERDLDIRFNMSDSEGNEEAEDGLNSEDPDTDEDRIIAGVRVSDILKKMDSADAAEGAAKASVDDLETQVGKPGGGIVGRSAQSIADKLRGLYVPGGTAGSSYEMPQHGSPSRLDATQAEMFGGFLSPRLTEERVSFLKNIKLKTPQEIKEMANGLNGRESVVKDATKISEKRQLGSSLFRNDITSKSVENLVLNGDLDKSSLEFDLGNDGSLFDNGLDVEKALENRHKVLEKMLKDIEVENDLRMNNMKEKFKDDEILERNRLKLQMEERMLAFEANLREQQSSQETAMKETMDLAAKQTSETLSAEQEANLQTLRSDFEAKFNEERKRLDSEFKEKIESLKQDMAEMLKRMEKDQSDEKKRIVEDMMKKNKKEADELREKLSEESEARRQLAGLEAQVSALTSEQTTKLSELQTSVAETIEAHAKTVEALQGSHDEELEKLRSDHADAVEKLQSAQRERIEELEREHGGEEESCRREHEAKIAALRADQASQLETRRVAHEKEEVFLRDTHDAVMEQTRNEHATRLESVRNESLREEEVVRREHLERLNELKTRLESERQRLRSHSDDKEASGLVFEKLRCEKRLLEDKYRTLKDKYVRLKGDVKVSMERRRKRENAAANATGSETERSTSHRATDRSAFSDCSHPPKNDNEKQVRKRQTDNNNGAGNKNATSPKNLQSRLPSEEGLQGVDSDNVSSSSSPVVAEPAEHHRKRRQLFGRLKSASTSHIYSNGNNNNNNDDELGDNNCSPVENLRRQLQKLDDLEEQFPPATHTDTYLRYPFSDPGQCGSSELEFFRHRIHLERDSVRRAKDFLQAQRTGFRARQRQLRQRRTDGAPPARSAVEQLADEERQLTDMEVSLHRTRGLLGEKIIRLRHLEQSLHRVASPKVAGDEAATLSDVSSHSGGSSGFSSIDLPHDAVIGPAHATRRPVAHPYQESTEIIHSLENLNAEIHDIWDVLSKSRPDPPPTPFVVPGGWLALQPPPPPPPPPPRVPYRQPPAATQPTLVERTKSLRDWLRQARIDSAELTSPCQATL